MRYIAVLLAAVLAGCTTTDATLLKGQSYSPTDSVEILLQEPSRPYQAFAIVEATGGHKDTSQSSLFDALREKAASIGADAVMPTERDAVHNPGSAFFNPYIGAVQAVGPSSRPIIRGLAIKYTDGP